MPDLTWIDAVTRLRSCRERGVLVTLTAVRGHAPQRAGAKMVVSAEQTWGTIGGGNVEAVAIARARDMLVASANVPEVLESALSDKAPFQYGVQCCGGEVSLLLEPLPVVAAVAIFGVGHVGLELARILARHDLELHLIDTRPEQLTGERLAVLADSVARVHVHSQPLLPEIALDELPPGAHVLIMTHDHAEDVALCDAVLRHGEFGSIGLIGSSAKWARFRRRLRTEGGHDDATINRIKTPIGLGDITGKEPATIAVSVAADLLRTFERERASATAESEPVRLEAVNERCTIRRSHDRREVMSTARLYRAHVMDVPDSPFRGGALRADADAGLLVVDGVITERDAFERVRARNPDTQVVELHRGLLLPGLVDTHVHYPQLRVIGSLGMPLLDWLDRCALPEEARFADVKYARAVAGEFVAALAAAGTTTALVFGSHYPAAVDALFAAATERGLRITSGLVLGDRFLRPELCTTARRGYEQGLALARRWHSVGRTRYAVTPRFSLSCTDELLEACRALHDDVAGSWFTSHLNENVAEVAEVRRLFDCAAYLDSYEGHGLVGPRSIFAHNVHPTETELELLGARGASVAHCATSNAALGSGSFPFDQHLAHDVRVALGCDVGGGTGFSLFKEGLQAYFIQRLRGTSGVPLSSAHLLYLATAAGAAALGLDEQIGDLRAGKRFDALWLDPAVGTPLEIGLRHAASEQDALAKVFALATPHDVAAVWVDGNEAKRA